jgi:hypothetical protein
VRLMWLKPRLRSLMVQRVPCRGEHEIADDHGLARIGSERKISSCQYGCIVLSLSAAIGASFR